MTGYCGAPRLKGSKVCLRAFKTGDWFDVYDMFKLSNTQPWPFEKLHTIQDAVDITVGWIFAREKCTTHIWAAVDIAADKIIGIVYSGNTYLNPPAITIHCYIPFVTEISTIDEIESLIERHLYTIDSNQKVEMWVSAAAGRM